MDIAAEQTDPIERMKYVTAYFVIKLSYNSYQQCLSIL